MDNPSEPRRPREQSLVRFEPLTRELGPPAGMVLEGGTFDWQRHFSLREHWNVLMKHRWIVFSCLVIVVTLATIITFRMTPKYEALARIAVYREDFDVLGFKDIGAQSAEDWDYTVALETQVQILQSDELALQVIHALGLERNKAFARAIAEAREQQPAGSLQQSGPTPEEETQLLSIFHGNVSVGKIPKTRLIEIRFLSPDPKLAADVVNTMARLYLERNFKMKFEATSQTSDWLAQQLADLKLKVESAQEKLVQYQRVNDIVGIDEKQNVITSKLNELNQYLTIAEADRMKKQADYQVFVTGKADDLPAVTGNQLIQKLREGPRVAVYDAASGERLEWSEDLRGTDTWRPFQFTFTTPDTTRLLGVRVVREAQTMLRGRLWLDDLSLAPRSAGGGR